MIFLGRPAPPGRIVLYASIVILNLHLHATARKWGSEPEMVLGKTRDIMKNPLNKKAPPRGFEPRTDRFEVWRSVQLSYEGV